MQAKGGGLPRPVLKGLYIKANGPDPFLEVNPMRYLLALPDGLLSYDHFRQHAIE